MAIELFRIDDRLVHGQVVVGWGQPPELVVEDRLEVVPVGVNAGDRAYGRYSNPQMDSLLDQATTGLGQAHP